MAIQNFVAGGFYGKLGAMVGQRWKNKRTLRTWVKPKNPRTEAQQANRGRFGGCVQLAQIAMQMNWKAPCWQSESLTEWNLRMSSATMLNKAELEPFNKIPLFPYAYVAKYAIHELKVKSKDPNGKVTFSVVGELPTEDRNISVLLGYINASTGAYDMELFTSTLTTNEDDEKVFSIEINDVSKVNNDSIYLICSNDDEKHDNESIYSNQIGAEMKIIKVFDTNIIEYTRTANKHFFTFAEEYFPSETSVTNVKLYGVVAGNYETLTLPSVTLQNFGGHFGFSMEQSVSDNFHIVAFASLSNIQIESISADSEALLSKAENTLNSFSSDDLTRRMTAEVISRLSETNKYTLTVKANTLDSSANASQIKTNAVIAGAFKEWVPSDVKTTFSEDSLKVVITKDNQGTFNKPIFNSQSKITSGKISETLSEVLYELDLSNIAVEDTDKTILITPEVVNKQSFTDAFILTIKNPLNPEYLDVSGIKTNAVIAGVFTQWIPSNVTARTSNENLMITITKDNQDNSAKPIFNSKSSITEGKATRELNEVQYGMNLAGIAVEDTDKSATWDNTIKSVENYKEWYFIKLKEETLFVEEEWCDVTWNGDSILGETVTNTEEYLWSDEDTGEVYFESTIDGLGDFESIFLTTGSQIKINRNFSFNEVTYRPKVQTMQTISMSDNTFYFTIPNIAYITTDSDGWQTAIVGLPVALDGVTGLSQKDTMINEWYTALNAGEWRLGFGATRGMAQTEYTVNKRMGDSKKGGAYFGRTAILYTHTDYQYSGKYMYVITPNKEVMYEKNLPTRNGNTVNVKFGFNFHPIGSYNRQLWTTQQAIIDDYGYTATRYR